MRRADEARTLGFEPPAKDTFQEVSIRYLAFQKARLTPRAFERSRGIVQTHFQLAFGPRRLADIRRIDVERYLTQRSAHVAPGTVTKELNTLKHIFNCAVDWELIPVNPAARVRPPRVPAGRVRYLQPTELRAVLECCPDWLRPIVAFLAFTGMRRSEVLGLRWLDIDRKGERFLLPQTKNRSGRVVWLNRLALRTLDSLNRQNATCTDRVFPPSEQVTPENVSMSFLRARLQAGIADFRLHDLRHTAASWLRMQGADIHVVALLLGHKDLRMAARYQHLSPAHLQEAARGLDIAFGPELSKLPAFAGISSETTQNFGTVAERDRDAIKPINGSEPLLTDISQSAI
jgi:integrase